MDVIIFQQPMLIFITSYYQFYIYCIIVLLVGIAIFYWRKQTKLSRLFLDSLSMQMHYRFHNIEDKYSGNGRTKNGALVITMVRSGDDVRNVVVKSVKLSDVSFIVNLNHFMMITFPNDSDTAHEASLRFRMQVGRKIRNANHSAYVKGFFTLESSGRIPFRARILISSFEE